jgi:hypothetical protein
MQLQILSIGITLGVLGGGLFVTGILMSMEPLTITGIVLLVASILLFLSLFCKKSVAVEESSPPNPIRGMKRNKSDTDLELMRQEPGV